MALLLPGLLLLVLGLRLLLRRLNLRHLATHGDEVPSDFAEVLDRQRLARISDYTLARSRLGLWQTLVGQGALLLFLLAGGLAAYDRWVTALTLGWWGQGMVFFGGLLLAALLLGLPFDAWGTFVVEARFGFNRSTVRLWLADQLKGLLVSGILLGALLSGLLALLHALPNLWWLPAWLLLGGFLVFVMVLSPYLIEPLFFRFQPLADDELAGQVRALVARSGLRVQKILQVDASRRSGHSNAYFTGLGRDKRVVLFDTLLQQMDRGEILAVLAHELGHWHYGHIRQGLLTGLLGVGGALAAAAWLLPAPWLPALGGMAQASLPARLLLLALAGSALGFFLTPVSSWLSRRREWQADAYAVSLTNRPSDLASALVTLSLDNLSNLHPHPVYAAVYYSHPPVTARLRRLRST